MQETGCTDFFKESLQQTNCQVFKTEKLLIEGKRIVWNNWTKNRCQTHWRIIALQRNSACIKLTVTVSPYCYITGHMKRVAPFHLSLQQSTPIHSSKLNVLLRSLKLAFFEVQEKKEEKKDKGSFSIPFLHYFTRYNTSNVYENQVREERWRILEVH